MQLKNLHIIIYLSYDCNLRCSYCVINYNKKIISLENLSKIFLFIKENSNKFENIYLEFIGGEPLLFIDKIDFLLSKELPSNVAFQITTNGTLINRDVYTNVISKIDKVNLSYNENYFLDNSLFSEISNSLINKNNININFIYDPRKDLSQIKKNFLFMIKQGYTNINILPIVLVYNYSKQDFSNLIHFINFVLKIKFLNISFLYYIQEKYNHFELTIDPEGNVLGDNMGTAEEYFGITNKKNNSIGKIGDITLEDIILKLSDYSYIDYLKNITKGKNAKQSYNNLLLLSNLLKKYNG